MGLQLAESIRDQLPGVKMITHCGGGSVKSQMKKADKSGASIALIIAEDELSKKQVTVKYLRENKEQLNVSFDELVKFMSKIV
jgi:histidyl-tRNA synthetase